MFTNLLGEGVFLIGLISLGFGSIFDPLLSGSTTDLAGADIGLILLVWVGFLNPKDDANPLEVGSGLFEYWLAWNKIFVMKWLNFTVKIT